MNFANKTITKQRRAFKEWGVMADWKNSCYYTFSPEYESDQLEVFFQMYEQVSTKLWTHEISQYKNNECVLHRRIQYELLLVFIKFSHAS